MYSKKSGCAATWRPKPGSKEGAVGWIPSLAYKNLPEGQLRGLLSEVLVFIFAIHDLRNKKKKAKNEDSKGQNTEQGHSKSKSVCLSCPSCCGWELDPNFHGGGAGAQKATQVSVGI